MNKYTTFEILEKSAETLKVMAHPVRLAILEALILQGKLSVTDIYKQLDIEQSVISYHLKNMRMVNLVSANRKGTKIFYDVTQKEISIIFDHIKALVA